MTAEPSTQEDENYIVAPTNQKAIRRGYLNCVFYP
jgi:hypothetical protein